MIAAATLVCSAHTRGASGIKTVSVRSLLNSLEKTLDGELERDAAICDNDKYKVEFVKQACKDGYRSAKKSGKPPWNTPCPDSMDADTCGDEKAKNCWKENDWKEGETTASSVSGQVSFGAPTRSAVVPPSPRPRRL